MTALRRDFLKAGGALIVGFHLRDVLLGQDAPRRAEPWPARRMRSRWIPGSPFTPTTPPRSTSDSPSSGQGNSTALLQVAAEELDFDMSQLKTVRLDTNITPNQGGTYSSASIQRGGPQVRTARLRLGRRCSQLASKKLDAPVEWARRIAKGVVSVRGDERRSVTYGELVGDGHSIWLSRVRRR